VRRPGPVLGAALRPLGVAYGLAMAARNRLYDAGALRTMRLAAPVLSVGNLTVGGTGKTPAVAAIVRRLVRRGARPGILSRGYRGQGGASDESHELAAVLPGVPHVLDPDRVRGGARLIERGADVVVLDDGFQHRRLGRDLDLVLVDAMDPFGGGRTLPAGGLREPIPGLARADLVLLTRSDRVDAERRAEIWRRVEREREGLPRIEARHAPRALLDPATGAERPAENLRGRRVALFSGIGNPDAFEATVRSLGAAIEFHRRFPDHHPFRDGEIRALRSAAGDLPLLTTGKDATRVESRLAPPWWVLRIEFEFLAGADAIEAALDRFVEKRPRGPQNAST